MAKFISKKQVREEVASIIDQPDDLLKKLEDAVTLPTDLNSWLSRLRLLSGVPIHYLVPDENMLPPESIRFFHLDINWIDALIDGAYSIGRNLADETNNNAFDLKMDRATFPGVRQQIDNGLSAIRARKLGIDPSSEDILTVTGFLLRSKVVSNYPGFGVNAYEYKHTPEDANPKLMTILRFEKLGDHSDTLICLVAGDVYRADIHEAGQHLHYGIKSYDTPNGQVEANKPIWQFQKTRAPGNKVTLTTEIAPFQIGTNFRNTDKPAVKDQRTIQMAALANAMKTKLGKDTFDSADFGFEMVEGVQMTQFINSNNQGS